MRSHFLAAALIGNENRFDAIWLTVSGAEGSYPWQPKQLGMGDVLPCWKVSIVILVSSSEPRCGLFGSAGPPAFGTGSFPEAAPPLVHRPPTIS